MGNSGKQLGIRSVAQLDRELLVRIWEFVGEVH
jgi:hypothetical protein